MPSAPPRPLCLRSALLVFLPCAVLLARAAVTPVVVKRGTLPVADEQLAWSRELSTGFEDGMAVLEDRSAQKDASSNSSSSASASATSTSTAAESSSTSTSSSSSSSSSFEMPQPFDQVLSTNFTSSSCPVYFQNFLEDSSFKSCANMWLLTQTSTAFFEDVKDNPNTTITQILDTACSADADTCEGVMGRIAQGMKATSACGKDLAAENTFATIAYQGLLSYSVMRDATCLKDNSTGSYCYAEAVESSSPDDQYLYELAAGTSLPSAYKATCDDCSKQTIAVFAEYASNSSLFISKSYTGARQQLATFCGPTFAPLEQTSHRTSDASSSLTRAWSLAAIFTGTVLFFFL